jgi:nicotinate-nucleotide--dimethylbenzimidazole phosphoribosyltransferase
VGLIQQSLEPALHNPQNIIFAADHGIVDEGVSFSPKEVTWQQISNFLRGGAGVNFFCRQHGFELKIVDAGVDYDFPAEGESSISRCAREPETFCMKRL